MGSAGQLILIEISHVFSAIKTNSLRKSLFTCFSQTAESEQVRRYMARGREIAAKNIKTFSSILMENDLPAPMAWDAGVMNTAIAPFSDKLMMSIFRNFNVVEIGNYGKALAACLRHDLTAAFGRIITEVASHAEDGVKILIDDGWMELTPMAKNPDTLIKH